MGEQTQAVEVEPDFTIPEQGLGQMSEETAGSLHRMLGTPTSQPLPEALLKCHDQLKFLYNRLQGAELEWQFLLLAIFLSGVDVTNAPFNGMFSATLAREGGAVDLDEQVDDLCSDVAGLAERLRKLEARLEENRKPEKAKAAKNKAKKEKTEEKEQDG